MCLSIVYSEEKKNRIIEEMPVWVPCWKNVEIEHKQYCHWVSQSCSNIRPVYNNTRLKANQVLIRDNPKPLPNSFMGIMWQTEYNSGFHGYCQMGDCEDASRFGTHPAIIKCWVHKRWITTIGKQDLEDKGLTIVSKYMFFPKYPETEAKINLFTFGHHSTGHKKLSVRLKAENVIENDRVKLLTGRDLHQ